MRGFTKSLRDTDRTPRGSHLFGGVRPSSGAAGLGAGETWQSSGVFGVETLLLPRTAALLTLNPYLAFLLQSCFSANKLVAEHGGAPDEHPNQTCFPP